MPPVLQHLPTACQRRPLSCGVARGRTAAPPILGVHRLRAPQQQHWQQQQQRQQHYAAGGRRRRLRAQQGPDPDADAQSQSEEEEVLSDSELELDNGTTGSSTRRPATPGPPPPQGPSNPWPRRVLQVPLAAAAALSKEDAHYLAKRGRTRWWRTAQFPRVPGETDPKQPPELQIWMKVLPLGLIFFVASFNLTILQNLKDAIMVTTAGAETLPFLASCIVLPASLGFFMLYGKMVEALPAKTVFYAALSPLLAFYVLFTAVLYPMHPSLHLNGFYAATASLVPAGLHGLLKVIEYWTFSLFYCASELWGSVVISVLFWSLANEVCTVTEAKTVYPLMGIAANVALVLAGSWVKWVNSNLVPLAGGSTQAMLNYLMGGVVVLTGVMMGAKFSLDNWCVGDYCAIAADGTKPVAKKKKQKGSLGESFAVIRSSPKIMNLALLVVSYGVSHRLFEFAWKGQLRALYPTPAAYQSVLADVSIATGWCTIALMLLGKFVFQHLGWIAAASATPAIMLAAGAGFFGLSLAANQGISVLGMDPTAMALAGVAAGAVTQVFARSAKFSLFDPAKEMVYIEMSREEKSKGKAAVDLLGSQIGKSGGAWITQALLLVTGSIAGSMPIIALSFTGVILSWLRAVMGLGAQLKEYELQKAGEAAAAATVAANGGAPSHGDGPNNGGNGNGPGAAAPSPAITPQAA